LSSDERIKCKVAGPDQDGIFSRSSFNEKYMNIEYIGELSPEQVIQYLLESDILLFPSKREAESLGLVVVEALSSGVLVCGYSIGCLPEIVNQDRRNGVLVTVGSREALLKATMRLIQTVAERGVDRRAIKESVSHFREVDVSEQLWSQIRNHLRFNVSK